MTGSEARTRSGAETLLLLAAAVVLALFLNESAGIRVVAMTSYGLLAALPALVMALCVLAHRWNLRCLHMSVCAAVFGGIGMLAGAHRDFGQFGLLGIADWCTVLQPLSLETARNQVASASWTYAGMLGGCNAGLALSTRFFRQSASSRPEFVVRFIACNAGMMLGMLLTEVLPSGGYSALNGVPAAARVILTMMVGMTAGMWGGWWCAEWALRGWKGRVRSTALQHAASLRS